MKGDFKRQTILSPFHKVCMFWEKFTFLHFHSHPFILLLFCSFLYVFLSVSFSLLSSFTSSSFFLLHFLPSLYYSVLSFFSFCLSILDFLFFSLLFSSFSLTNLVFPHFYVPPYLYSVLSFFIFSPFLLTLFVMSLCAFRFSFKVMAMNAGQWVKRHADGCINAQTDKQTDWLHNWTNVGYFDGDEKTNIWQYFRA